MAGLAVLYVLFGAIPLAALTYFSLSLADRAVRDNVRDRLVTTASVSSVVVAQRLDFLGQLVAGAAAAPDLARGLDEAGSQQAATLRSQVDALRTPQSGISEVLVADLAGHALASSQGTEFFSDFSRTDWFRAVSRHPATYISATYTPNFPGARRAIAVAAPVLNADGQVLGILAAAYSLDALQTFATQLANAQGIELLITDQTGVVVARPGSDQSSITSVREDHRIGDALADRSSYGTVVDPTGNRLYATQPVHPVRWTVTASIREATALASLHHLRSAVLGVAGVLAAFLLVGLVLQVALALKRVRSEQRLAQTARSLSEARDKALTASENKSRLLATVSHEIRNPMNGVLGMTRLLGETELDADQRRYTAAATSSAVGLLAVVNDLLDLSRIEAGRLRLQVDPFDVRALCTDVVGLFTARAAAQALALDVHVEPTVPTTLVGDSQRIRQVLINLLTNAVKFTPAGAVSLRVTAEGTGQPDLVRVTFAVADTGLGLAPGEQSRVFERFTRGSDAAGLDGVGLGLTITEELVTLMGGDLGVESAPGAGSRFWFGLVLTAAPAAPTGPYSTRLTAPAPNPDHPPGRVLVVEDDEVSQLVAERVLHRGGFTVDVVEDGDRAIAAAVTGRYDAILMDLQLPSTDGITVTRRIRETEHDSRRTPVIAMTASVTQADRDRCLAAGMDGFVAKPVDWEQLLCELRLHTWAPTPDTAPAAASGATGNWDERAVADLEKAGVLDEAAEAFRRSAPDVLDRIEAAAARGQLSSLSDLVHRLKGAAGTVGALELTRLCDELADRLQHDATVVEGDDVVGAFRDAVTRAVCYLDGLTEAAPTW